MEVYDQCVVDKNTAISVLNNKLDWSLGLIFSILYRDVNNKVQVITAVGIKNSNECGPFGRSDPDEWINSYYSNELDVHGGEFYRIIGDSGRNISTTSNKNNDFHTTRVVVNKTHYDVLNSKDDIEISDPFKVQELQ